MREIKFRAIHKLTKKKWDEEELVFHSGKWYENWRAFEDGIPLNLQQCAVMQYTGLTDKNGVEVYEGDIYKTPTGLIGRVFFHANGGWLVETKEREFTLLKINASKQGEVIGNIYENPELLEGAK